MLLWRLHDQSLSVSRLDLPQRHEFETGSSLLCRMVDCVWNVMAHAQKPGFVFRRNGRVLLNRRVRQFSLILAAELCASGVVMLDNTLFRGSMKGTGYPLHSPVSPSLSLPCVTMCHHISTGLWLGSTGLHIGFLSLGLRFHCTFNPLNAELNPIGHLSVLLRAQHILHVSRIRVKIFGWGMVAILLLITTTFVHVHAADVSLRSVTQFCCLTCLFYEFMPGSVVS